MRKPDLERNTLCKAERISDKEEISLLFREENRGKLDGMRYSFRRGRACDFNRILIAVPKRLFKRAVDRNLLKRRIRQAYMTQKSVLKHLGVDVMFMYDSKEVMEYSQIRALVGKTLAEVSSRIAEAEGRCEEEECRPKQTGMNEGGARWKMRKILIAPFVASIKFYRMCISPHFPPRCRFTPTCSQYALDAFRKWGPIKGLYLTVRRLLRCHPWGRSGYDPVP